MPKISLALAATCVLLASYAGAAHAGGGAALDRLVSRMTGTFSSAAQAARDTHFLDIRLHVVPIWAGRAPERWLYVEQAASGRLDRPYRQRVYRVSQRPDGTFESAVYTLPAPLRFAGAWRSPERFDTLAPDSLEVREGCAVILRARGSRFEGGTEGRGCASDLRGAVWASSEVRIEARRMITLDRGWTADGRQVWGSEHGGYVFDRVEQR